MEEEEKGLGKKIEDLTETVKEALEKNKPKGMGLPFFFKTRLSKSKLKKGFVVVMEIGDNKHITFRKEPIINNTIRLDDTFHAITDLDLLFYKNKPFVVQLKGRLNPYNPTSLENQTYGQKYVMARMLGDAIKQKMKINWTIAIIILAALGVGAYFLSSGGII